MKYWTIQKKAVVNAVLHDEMYQPDFTKSDYLQKIPNLQELYYFILESFNDINNVNLPGVIFGFVGSNNESLFEISNLDEFYGLISSNKNAIKSLWNHFIEADAVLLELDYNSEFLNPVYIDINDFQFLMPPIVEVPPYTNEDVKRLISYIERGKITRSVFPSNIIQAHLPYIKKENMVAAYNLIPLDEI